MDVCTSAIRALEATSAAHEIDDCIRESHISKIKVATSPAPPKVPMLLPSIHQMWSPLLAVLKDHRVSVLEHAFKCLTEMTRAAGGNFMARRVQDEAWPIARLLLRKGLARISSRSEESFDFAPNAMLRIQKSVLNCVAEISGVEQSKLAFRWIVADIINEALVFLGANQPLPLREAASAALVSLANVDADAVWLSLKDLSSSDPGIFVQSQLRPTATFPEFKKILPTAPKGLSMLAFKRLNVEPDDADSIVKITCELASKCGKWATKLLDSISHCDIHWHGKVRDSLFRN